MTPVTSGISYIDINGFPDGELASEDDLVRLHMNESPYGAPPGVAEILTEELAGNICRYPQGESDELRGSIARFLGCGPDMVAVGNGVDELIQLTVLAFCRGDTRVVTTDSTFPGYLMACAALGVTPEVVPLEQDRVAADALIAALRKGAGLVYLCNPHNPTGTLLDRAVVDEIVAVAEEVGAVLVIDEAYMDFVSDDEASEIGAVLAGRRAVVLRTFSKAWGLASLRVGYAVGPPDLISQIWQARRSMPFNINRLAQVAVRALLGQHAFLQLVRDRTAQVRELLGERLSTLGIGFVPSATNFVMVEAGPDSATVAKRLAVEHRILVRDLTSFGRPGWIRVTLGTRDEIERFTSALGAVREGCGREPSFGETAVPHWRRPVPTLPAMQPEALFNGYTGAQVAFALHEFGIWETLARIPTPVRILAARAGTSIDWMLTLLRTMALLGYVELRGQTAAITEAGRSLTSQMGLFVWGVGGYGPLLRNLSGLATGRLTYGTDVRRDEVLIATGAGEADRSLMQPIEAKALSGIDFGVMADIGCGDATRLIRLCGDNPDRRGVGIEISAPACELATERIRAAGLADRVEVICENVLDSMSTRTFPGVDLVASFLMLHDLFAGDEDHAAVIRRLLAAFPDARHFLFADTAAQSWEEHSDQPPIFNLEFELVHAAMGVPLRTKETYLRAFTDAGLRLERCEPFGVPSTWLFLLSNDAIDAPRRMS